MTTSPSLEQPLSHWQGSEKTYEMVKEQIMERWGEEEAEKYDPITNCFTYKTWRAMGFQVRKGEHGLLSFTVKEGTIGEDEDEPTHKFMKKVYLFYYLQVDKIQ